MMINDEILAYLELSGDLLFHKIPEEQIRYYIDKSLKIGKETAKKIQEKNIQNICRDEKIDIKMIDSPGKLTGINLRGQSVLDKNSSQIVIYMDSIRELSQNSLVENDQPLTEKRCLEMHLAHELFHYLEYKNNFYVSNNLKKIVRLKLPFLKLYSSLLKCSEIAAHGFTKAFLGLKHLPNIYDYYYLIQKGVITRDFFQERLKQAENQLSALSNQKVMEQPDLLPVLL